jgi:hypothetical protein
MMLDWRLLMGGAVVTSIAGLWSYFRWMANYARSLAVTNHQIDSDIATAMFDYLGTVGEL